MQSKADLERRVEATKTPPKDHDVCEVCEARACGMCSDLAPNQLNNLRKITRNRDYKAGEVIFSDDQPLESYATIKNGIVKLSKVLPDGRQQTIGLCFPPDFIGRTYKDKNAYFASAVTDVAVCTFPRDMFNSFLKNTPTLEHRLFELTLNELDTARDLMLMLGRMSALEKVATLIINLSERLHRARTLQGEPSNELSFELPLTREEISDFLGLTIETVSRQFSQLNKQNLINITQKRYIEILDKDKLKELAGIAE